VGGTSVTPGAGRVRVPYCSPVRTERRSIQRDRGPVLNVTFYGVRGSTPCASDDLARYGGNTACVVLDERGQAPIVLDLGTGLRFFGLDWARRNGHSDFRATALLTHLHWDHVQGIPFFAPILSEGSCIDVHGPVQDGGSLEDVVRTFLAPPYFPVGIDSLPGRIDFHETTAGEFRVGEAVVQAGWVPHCGPTLGYRVTMGGRSVAYLSDHQQPGVGSTEVDPGVLDLCRDVDLLIHDAQYDLDEFAARVDWGHCTTDYAVEVGIQSGARTLVLFHHDPSHTDDRVDQLLERAVEQSTERSGPEVVAAHEGLTIALAARRESDAADLRVRADAAASAEALVGR